MASINNCNNLRKFIGNLINNNGKWNKFPLKGKIKVKFQAKSENGFTYSAILLWMETVYGVVSHQYSISVYLMYPEKLVIFSHIQTIFF